MTRLLKLASILGSAAALGGYAAYRRDMAAIRSRLAATRQLAQTARGPVEYGREGEGEPVLAIHGAGGGFDQGLFVGGETFGPGYDIVAPSRFGYLGAAVPADASHAAQADAHAALLDSLDVGRAIVMGVSAGAPSAIEFALRHPARTAALVLLVPRAYSPEIAVGAEQTPPNRAMMKLMLAGSDSAYWAAARLARSAVVQFLGVPPAVEAGAPPEERARVDAIIRSILPLSERVRGILVDSAAGIAPWPLERIQAPTLVVSAEDDLFHTLPAARFTAAHIAGAELSVLESGGHLMVGRGEEVRRRVATFIAARAAPELAAAA